MKTPNDKDRETAREVVRHGLSRGAYAQLPKAVTRLEDAIAEALHSTRISALKEAAEVLKNIQDTLLKFGDWDDGCFYYQGRTASELGPILNKITKTLKELEGK